ncbi:MAG: hypothetical protein R2778_01345 [Saprospiraceae bacterium]
MQRFQKLRGTYTFNGQSMQKEIIINLTVIGAEAELAGTVRPGGYYFLNR